jgi:hypothetical protein
MAAIAAIDRIAPMATRRKRNGRAKDRAAAAKGGPSSVAPRVEVLYQGMLGSC